MHWMFDILLYIESCSRWLAVVTCRQGCQPDAPVGLGVHHENQNHCCNSDILLVTEGSVLISSQTDGFCTLSSSPV